MTEPYTKSEWDDETSTQCHSPSRCSSVTPIAEPLRSTSRTISSASLQSTICAESLFDVENLDIESLVEQVRESGGPLVMDEDERSFDTPLDTLNAVEASTETSVSAGGGYQLLLRNDGYDVDEDEYDEASDDEQLEQSLTPTLSADTISVDLESSIFPLTAPSFTSEEDWQEDNPGEFEGGVGDYADALQMETGSPRRLALVRKLRQSDGFGFMFVEPGH
ncbi:hypothetical protein HDU80_004093 [Chytriomyces hyalinus]|nr:hypothetical protein HDU80_004093 [Chytriomyces hyalinus]